MTVIRDILFGCENNVEARLVYHTKTIANSISDMVDGYLQLFHHSLVQARWIEELKSVIKIRALVAILRRLKYVHW